MENISVITVVYNEENRIEEFLKCFSWSDDLIIVDKSSTDMTRDICLRYTPSVITVPYTDAGDISKCGLDLAKNEWIMAVTASDLIEPELVKEIIRLINSKNFDYDIISIPFDMFVFGIKDKRSPWCTKSKTLVIKKAVLYLKDEVHHEINTTSTLIYKIDNNYTGRFYHLTHQDLNIFFERHIRYTKLETKKYIDESRGLRKSFFDVIKSIIDVIFRRKSFLLGWDGVALSLAYVSYFIFKFLFVWEKFRGKGTEEYINIKSRVLRKWDSLDYNKGIFKDLE